MTMMLLALVVFAFTYLLIITEWINKMLAALMGGFLVVLFGILPQSAAFAAIDWNVIFLLIGMMLVMSVLKETGIFQFIAIKTAKLAKAQPLRIMIYMFVITAVISAFLDNVTTVMILIPIVLLIANQLKISPIPFIINMAIASNIGGTATMIGDPPNILIGSATELSFMDFIFNLTPIIVINLIVSVGVLHIIYRRGIHVSSESRARLMEFKEDNLIKDKKLLYRSLVIVFIMLVAFTLHDVIHIEPASVAMTAGILLLILHNRKKVDHVLMHDVDWATIFFFMGLFMIVESLKQTGVIDLIAKQIVQISQHDLKTTSIVLLWFSGIFSAIIDNVPFVTTMIPLLKTIGTYFPDTSINPLWWSLSLGACLGGNGTLIGASANIVSVGIANRNGFHISFKEFTKLGMLHMFLSLVISNIYILLRYF